jgi:hypothetical protein
MRVSACARMFVLQHDCMHIQALTLTLTPTQPQAQAVHASLVEEGAGSAGAARAHGDVLKRALRAYVDFQPPEVPARACVGVGANVCEGVLNGRS